MIDYEMLLTVGPSPELKIGQLIKIEDVPLVELVDRYEELMLGVIYSRVARDKVKIYARHIFDWLRQTDFYSAPASTVYHESMVGGLLVHSLKVYNNIISLLSLPQFEGMDKVSATLVALVHDWCKIGLYEAYDKNVKNNETGQWEQQKAFRINATGVPLGHGVSSMFLASRFFKLTTDEALAIRWHMGRFNVAENEINDMQRANETYPLVLLVQFADSLAITSYANNNLV